MKHILFISHARGIHGAEAVMIQAVKACGACGAQVTVVVPSIVKDTGMEEALRDIPSVRVLALPYRAGGGDMLRTHLVRLYNIPALLRLKRFVEREHVDTIYSNTTITILGAELAKRTHCKHIWHWHEPVDERFGWHFTMKEYYREIVKTADSIVCISHQQQAEWEQALDLKLTQAQIIYNPIKPIAFTPADRHNFHRGGKIGFIGHFEERKNIGLLLRAFEALHAQESETTLSLCGTVTDDDRVFIENMTEMREPVMTILPQTSHVAAFYNRIDILVLPSWKETMPLVVLEAMQAGVCVLQTNQSGMSELLQDGVETLFFPPDDSDRLEQLLLQCMDIEYRNKIAEAGQKRAIQLVNNQVFDQQIQHLLCE